MGGKSSSVTTGFWYHVAYHHGLAATPIDAFLEFRCADKTAWAGELTASGTIHINQPQLFGGEKDQGGIVGDVDVMFGEPTQQPNAYLAQAFGPQQPGWRGVTTLVFKGGRFGANNPYPQAPAYKIRCIVKGWDGDPGDGSACWYPEKASVPLTSSAASLTGTFAVAEYADVFNPGVGSLGSFGSGYVGDANTIAQRCFKVRNTHDHTDLTFGQSYGYQSNGQWFIGCTTLENGSGVGYSAVAVAPICPMFGAKISLVEHGTPTPLGTSEPTVACGAPGFVAMNPAHILYDLLTSADRGAEPVASIHDGSFRAGADWFFANGVGLCTAYDPDAETVEQCKARIETVAGCSVSRSPVDGLWYLDIANGQYDLNSLPVLTDDDILEFAETPSTLDDAINSLSAEYFDVEQKVTTTTPPVQALSLINANGLHHDVHQYHELPTSALALRMIQRDLAASITPTRVFNMATTRKPFGWRTNTYFRLQTPKRGIDDMVCILAEKSSGTLKSGAMTLTASEDIYSLPASSFVTAEQGVDTRPPSIPIPITQQAVFEAPYTTVCASLSRADLVALPTDAGYMLAVASAPGDYIDYAVDVSADGGSTYAEVANGRWCPTALIIEGDALQDAAPATAFTLSDGALLASVVMGQAALWDDEICRVDAIDAAATPPTLTLGRGCADTVPAAHAENSRVWFYDGFIAADTTEYTAEETIDIKLLTSSGSQQLDPAYATPLTVLFAQRQSRPYAPAQLKINGSWYPEAFSGDLSLAWASRNRVQQADQLIDTAAAAITPESGVTDTLTIYGETGALLRSADVSAFATYTYTNVDELSDMGADASEIYWSNVVSLIHCDGVDGSTSVADVVSSTTWTVVGGSLTTANKKFGIASLLLPSSGNNLHSASNIAFGFGAGPFTVELWIYSGASGVETDLFDFRRTANSDGSFFINSGRKLSYWNGTLYGGTGSSVPVNTWCHIAFSVTGSTIYAFLNGVLQWSAAVNTNFGSSNICQIGYSPYGGNGNVSGCVDDVRITKGVARYTSNFTPPTRAFPETNSGQLNGKLRFTLGSARDGLESYQQHNVVIRRYGYGFNYGLYYGSSTTHQRGQS